VFRIQDRVTDGPNRPAIVLSTTTDNEETIILQDWRLLKVLNQLPLRKDILRTPSIKTLDIDKIEVKIEEARALVMGQGHELMLGYRVPYTELIAVLWPAN
jgi:hypothetical protein